MSIEDARTSVALIVPEVIPIEAGLAHKAGGIITDTKTFGLSLGDRACLALALVRQNTAVTAEKLWSKLKIGVTVEVIRGNAPALPEPES